MKKITLILSALLIFTGITVSQKKFTLNFYGGYTMPFADLKGDFPDTLGNTGLDFNKSKTLLTSSGFNGGVQGKYFVDSAGNARVTAGINYNSFSGSVDYTENNISYKNKVTIFTFTAGLEYVVNPSNKFVPFAGLDLAANIYSGKIEGSGDTTFVLNRKTETRFGIIASAGVEIKMWKSGGLVFGVKYAMTNLIGKKTETTGTTTVTDDVDPGSGLFNELPLNDKETSSNPDKTLNYVQIYAGISFNFGSLIGVKK